MGYFSDYAIDKILDHSVGKAAWTMPTLYTGYSTAEPLGDASGLAEPGSGGYAREVTAAGDWTSASGGATDNANKITHDVATGSQGTITWLVAFDALTGGNMIGASALDTSKTIGTGDTPTFPIGAFNFTLT